MDKILLVDGHSILNRAFYGLPDLTNSKGEHTNAVLGFINIILKKHIWQLLLMHMKRLFDIKCSKHIKEHEKACRKNCVVRFRL